MALVTVVIKPAQRDPRGPTGVTVGLGTVIR
jgi:hypothetical protein